MTTIETRYEVRAVGDADCTTVNDEVLATASDATTANDLASKLSAGECYGTAVVDTFTGKIDFGGGFEAE